jgi:hypothetical protein
LGSAKTINNKDAAKIRKTTVWGLRTDPSELAEGVSRRSTQGRNGARTDVPSSLEPVIDWGKWFYAGNIALHTHRSVCPITQH